MRYKYSLTLEKIILIINYLKESCGVKLEPREEHDFITWIMELLIDGVCKNQAGWHIGGNFGPGGELRLSPYYVFVASDTINPEVFGNEGRPGDEKYALKKRQINAWIYDLISIKD